MCIISNVVDVMFVQHIDFGLSPSGKATDSDSVTSKVRILPAQ